MPGSRPRWRIGVGAVVVGLGVLLVVAVLLSAVSTAEASGSAPVDRVGGLPSGAASQSASASASTSTATADRLFVHVLGRVVHPGLFEIPLGGRLVDAVTAAGGFTPEADQSQVNLARPVVDGEQISVPAVGETPVVVSPAGGSAGGGAGGSTAGGGALVDINHADSTALETLPGVGPATATTIIEWRTDNGRFASVDDLLAVSGIGEKKLERFRDRIVAG